MTNHIPLTQGFSAIVDDDDFEELSQHRWHALRQPRRLREEQVYACRHTYCAGRQSIVYMHRVVLGVAEGAEVDHANGDGLDNRRANLRGAAHYQNGANYPHSLNKTGYRGVHFRPRRGTFAAQIRVNGRTIWVGSFPGAHQAALAYDAAALIHHGEFATLNFPQQAGRGVMGSPWPRAAVAGSA